MCNKFLLYNCTNIYFTGKTAEGDVSVEGDLTKKLTEEEVAATNTEDEEDDGEKQLMEEEFGPTDEENPGNDEIEGETKKEDPKKDTEDDIDPSKING